MLEYLVLIILILIIIFIIYIYYFIQEKEIELEYVNTKVISKTVDRNYVSFSTDYLSLNKDRAYVIYYDLPLNSVYWTFSFFSNDKAISSVNMGKYQTSERGDTLAIIVSNNLHASNAVKMVVKNKHEEKYGYKKLIPHYLYIDTDFYIIFKSFSNLFNNEPRVTIKEYKFKDLEHAIGKNTELNISKQRECENPNYYIKILENQIPNNSELVEVERDTIEINTPFECLTNRSQVFSVSDKIFKCDKQIPPFIILAVDHFKSRAALHSNISFYDADTGKRFRTEITGEISDNLNHNQKLTCRVIKFFPPENVKRMYVIENIFYDFQTGSKVNPKTIIPISVYKILNV